MFTPDKELIQLCHCAHLDMDWVRRYGRKALKASHSKRIKNEAALIKDRIVEENGKCKICGMSYKPVLQLHHILPVSKFGNNNADNIICVCPNCHKTIHHLYRSLTKTDEEAAIAYIGVPKDIRGNVWDVVRIYAEKCNEVSDYILNYDDSDYEEPV